MECWRLRRDNFTIAILGFDVQQRAREVPMQFLLGGFIFAMGRYKRHQNDYAGKTKETKSRKLWKGNLETKDSRMLQITM